MREYQPKGMNMGEDGKRGVKARIQNKRAIFQRWVKKPENCRLQGA